MGALSFLAGILGTKKEQTWYEADKQQGTSGAHVPAHGIAMAAPEEVATPPDAILMREEIVDERHRLCGYRFTPKALSAQRPYPEPVFFEALRDDRVMEFAQRRMAVIPISPDSMIFGRHLGLLAPHTVFMIDASHTSLTNDELLGRLIALRDSGGRVALTNVSLTAETRPLVQAADMIFLDMADQPLAELQGLVRELRTGFPSLALVAVGVHSWAEQRMCSSWGFKYCLGDFLSNRDEDEEEGALNESQLASLEMLNLLRRDADLSELSAAAKQDPGLTFHLIKWANSPASGLSSPISSVHQAIMVLGRAQVYRWLMVAMFRMGSKRERDESLLEIALGRARCMETFDAPELSAAVRDELFLVGLLSLFDSLLRMPMAKILSQMHLSQEVTDVLLRSAGRYAPYLMLTLALEKGRVLQVADLAARLQIEPQTLQASHRAAFLWAQGALGATTPE